MFEKPTVEEFKVFFARDFPFQPTDGLIPPTPTPDPSQYVQDSDIQRAFMMTDSKFMISCFGEQEEYTLAYLFLAAHVLAVNLRNSNAGYSASFNWGSTSQSVGSVSISNNIPTSIMNNPLYAWLTSTNYGVEYLMMIIPCMIAPFGIAHGRTLA